MKKLAFLSLIGGALISFVDVSFATEEDDFKHWLVRGRAIMIMPEASSSTISNGVGGHVDSISTQVVPELDFTYFFTDNIAMELILATANHNVTATGTALGTASLGEVSLLPPTLLLQYHFCKSCAVTPYVGAGVNYTIFYDSDSGPVASDVDYSNSVGPAFQVGLDYNVTTNWVINADVKWIYIETDADATIPGVGKASTDVDINPWVFGLGIGYRF